jgi:hypothetical protein
MAPITNFSVPFLSARGARIFILILSLLGHLNYSLDVLHRYSKKSCIFSSVVVVVGMMDIPLSHSKYQDEYIIKMKIVCYDIRKYQYEYVFLHVHCNIKIN